MDNLLNIVIILLLVFMNAFFVAAEFSMVKIRKSRIETLVLDGDKNAKYALGVINNLNSYLSACQLGITLASLGLGWVGEPAVSKMLSPLFNLLKIPKQIIGSISVVVGFIIITGFHIVLGELAPKSVAILNTESIAKATAMPLTLFYKFTYPIIVAFNKSTDLVLKLFGIKQVDEHEQAHTDEEIRMLVEESYKHGLIDKTELTFVDNVFDFSEKTVKEIMVPRTDMKCIFVEDSFDDIVGVTIDEHFTRYPVCEESKDNIIGLIHIKDLYKLKINKEDEKIESIIREIKFVPESMSISELFRMFQKERMQMAIVIDEYGGTFGLVTIEDILEEIVGEIQDEFDEEMEEIKKTENGSYVVDGKVLIEDINELLDIEIYEENIDTIGGWIYSKLKKYPKPNEKINYGNYQFIILKCDRRRIEKILIKNL
ncbi:membrane protein [Clostridium acetobutylicum]|nr:membrane protein [Clostridium acetobutylicum]